SAALLDEDHLIDPGVLERPQVGGQVAGRADTAASADLRQICARYLKAVPDIGSTRSVITVDVVMSERVAEELEAFGAAPLRFGGVRMAGEAGHHGDVGVDAVADRHALLGLDDAVIFLCP